MTRLADLDRRRCTRESGQTRLESSNLTEWSTTTGVDASNTELVGSPRQQFNTGQCVVTVDVDDINVL